MKQTELLGNKGQRGVVGVWTEAGEGENNWNTICKDEFLGSKFRQIKYFL